MSTMRSPEGIVHLVAERLVDRSADLDRLAVQPPLPLTHPDAVPRTSRAAHVAPPSHPRHLRVIPKSRDFR